MVTLDLADELESTRAGPGSPSTVEPGVRAAGLPGPRPEPGGAGPGGLWPPGRRPSDQADPAGRRAGRRFGGRRRRAALGRLRRPRRGGRASGPTCRSAWSAAGPGSRGWGSGSPRCRSRPATYLLLLPPFGVETARVYRAWDEDPGHEAPNALTAAALAVEPRLAALARRPGGVGRDASRCWPGAARPGSSREVGGRGARTPSTDELRVGAETARLVRARTVPAGWEGD